MIRANGLHFHDLQFLAGITIITEDEWAIFTHTLLGNNHTLTALDNKVAAKIFGTFTKVLWVNVALVL